MLSADVRGSRTVADGLHVFAVALAAAAEEDFDFGTRAADLNIHEAGRVVFHAHVVNDFGTLEDRRIGIAFAEGHRLRDRRRNDSVGPVPPREDSGIAGDGNEGKDQDGERPHGCVWIWLGKGYISL